MILFISKLNVRPHTIRLYTAWVTSSIGEMGKRNFHR